GGKVSVEIIQKMSINKDKTVNVAGLLGNKDCSQRIACERDNCLYTRDMENIELIAEWED
ncbi:MAG: hypothetical protein ACRCX2_01610, partial [Paraclostridium sp.]